MTAPGGVQIMARQFCDLHRVDDQLVENRFVLGVLRSTMPLAAFVCLVDECDLQSLDAKVAWRCFSFMAQWGGRPEVERAACWASFDERLRAWFERVPWAWGDSEWRTLLGRAANVRARSWRRRGGW